MRLRIALRIYAGLYPGPLSTNSVRLATGRLHRLLQYREWSQDELRELVRREVASEIGSTEPESTLRTHETTNTAGIGTGS